MRLRHLSPLVLFAVAATSLAAGADRIQWIRDYGKGIKMARSNTQPVLIDFWATWCEPCKKMDQEVYSKAEVIDASKRFVCIQVDMDKSGATADRYKVEVIPTLAILDPWENTLLTHQNFTSLSNLLAMLKSVPQSFEPVIANFQALKQNKDDFGALVSVGSFYEKAGLLQPAREFYSRTMRTARFKQDPQARDEVGLSLGTLALKMNDLKAAETVLQKASGESSPANRPRVLLALAEVYARSGKAAEAGETWSSIMRQFPETESARIAKDNLDRTK